MYLSDDSILVANLDTSARILNGYPNVAYNEVIPAYSSYEYFKKYFWRVVEYDSIGITLGPLWYFRTRIWSGEIFEENFDSLNLDQWTIIGPNGFENWSLGFLGQASNDPPELEFSWWPAFTGNSYIKIIKILPGGYGAGISFDHYIDWYTDTATVGLAIKNINESEWTSIWEKRVTNNYGPTSEYIDLSWNEEIFYLAFYFSGNSFNIDYWYIDDIFFSHPIETYDPPGFLQVSEDSVSQKITLNWTPGYLPGPLSYKIERKNGLPTDTTSYYTIGYACNALLSYEDYEVQPNSIYTYRVHTVLPCPNSYYTSIGGNETTAYVPDLVTSNNYSQSTPTQFVLYQNYPNPFNPSTKIKYNIPSEETGYIPSPQVRLKVYDVLGNEIATLVNEQKPPGTYEVEFNTASHYGEVRNLTSGIYFYQLKVGSLIETKKMLLLK